MIEQAQGLTPAALEAISDLERRVVATDGGRLKLEWGVLRTRPSDQARDLLWWEDGRLLGFAGIYGYGSAPLEVTGMVDPRARRRGIGRAMWDAAAKLCHEHGAERVLLVVPRVSVAGREFARSIGLRHEHSEHALRLTRSPVGGGDGGGVGLRAAGIDDLEALSRLYDDGFHDGGHVDASRLSDDRRRTLLVTKDNAVIGTIGVVRDGARGAIYGFVIHSSQRGHGYGRAVLQRVCRDLLQDGAEYVDLEVATDNDHALGLYTSVGFDPLATDDYYELGL